MEPACFLSLFDGHMITHLGKRDDDEKKNSSKLYIVQHEHESEASLLEVPCTTESLRRLADITAFIVTLAECLCWLKSYAIITQSYRQCNSAHEFSDTPAQILIVPVNLNIVE